jgi:hypothetical protein
MADALVDRVARTLAGTRRPVARPVTASTEPAFTRSAALRTAAALGLAGSLGGLRTDDARAADACTEACMQGAHDAAGAALEICAGHPAAALTTWLWIPPQAIRNALCVALAVSADKAAANNCAKRGDLKDPSGGCNFDKPTPPPPRPPIPSDFPPIPTDGAPGLPPSKKKKNKSKTKTRNPGGCGPFDACFPGNACCGQTCCALGCKGDACCDSVSGCRS